MQVDGYSLDAQRDKLRKYAEYEDMVVAGEYSDEGFSGKNIQGRHEFQRMLQDIQDCKDGVEYVLVFKLSRFGRNAADVLNSLQLMQDFGVNLICVEDGIDSSKDSGKLMISVLSAVAEIERENIRTQTMAGREQKAREGKWNGGFAPYGYRLEKGELLIAEDEVDVIRTIFDRYIHTNDGVSGVAKYLNRQGFVKKLRQNGTIPGFSASFVKSIIDNPVYMGKIAYGRRRTEKKIGTRNEMHVVEQSEFPVYEGKHEAIISEEDWNLAQEKRKVNAYRREKVNDPTHAHILSGILKCPCCGKSLYGNIAKAHSKDKKTRYYYYCKNTVTPTGHECTFRLNIEQTEMNRMVASIISAMVSDPRFADAIKAKIGSAVDTNDLEKQLEALQAQLRQTLGTKARLERQMDGLDVNDPYYDRKISDLQRRYDEQYGAIDEIEVQIDDVQSQIRSIRQEKISGDNIYRLLLAFDQVYEAASEVERKEFMRAFIERIELFPEKQPDGNWIRKIIFNFPVLVNGAEVKELPLENETMVEEYVGVTGVSTATNDTGGPTETGGTGSVYIGAAPTEENPIPGPAGENPTKPGTLVWVIGNMGPNETRTLTYRVKLKDAYTGVTTKGNLQNTANVYSKTYQRDSDTVTFTPRAGATMSKVASTFIPGENGGGTITYTIWVKANADNSYVLDNVKIMDALDGSIENRNWTSAAIRKNLSYDETSFHLYQGGSNGQNGSNGLTEITAGTTLNITDTDNDNKFNDSFTYYVGSLAPGESKTLTYTVNVEPGVFVAAGNKDFKINNRACIYTDDSRIDGGVWLKGYNTSKTINRKVWSRKLAGGKQETESTVSMSGSVYDATGSSVTQITSPDSSFTVPAGSYKYQVAANEAGDWGLSSASLKDSLGSQYMQFVGYVRVDAYTISSNAPGSGLDDAAGIANLSSRTPDQTVWVKVDGQTSFSFTPEQIGLDGKKAYLLTYYAQPKNTDGITQVVVSNRFELTGEVVIGNFRYVLTGIGAEASVVVAGSNSFAAEKQSWYYEEPQATTGDFANGALYWVIKVDGKVLPSGTAIKDVTNAVGGSAHYIRSTSFVGVYTGNLGTNFLADYADLDSLIASNLLTALESSNYTVAKDNYSLTLTLNTEILLAQGDSLYLIVKTEPSQLPAKKRDAFTYNNKLQSRSDGTNWLDHNTASKTLYGSENIFKELGRVFTYPGSGNSITDIQHGTNQAISTGALNGAGTYVAWQIHVNYEGSLSGRYRVVEQIPDGMEVTYVRIWWLGSKAVRQDPKPTFARLTAEEIAALGGSWTEYAKTLLSNNAGSQTNYYYTNGQQVIWDIDNLVAGGGYRDDYAVEIQIVCKVTDPDVLLGGVSKEFNNVVSLQNSEGTTIGNDSNGVTIGRQSLSKQGTYNPEINGGRYPFKITLNGLGEDLVSGADTITLVDELSETLIMDTTSIQVVNTKTGEVVSNWTASVEGQTLKIVLPDNLPLTVTYETTVNAAPGQTISISNNAHWEGYTTPSGGSVEVEEFSYSTGGTVGADTSPSVTVKKLDQYNTSQTLSGATFTLVEGTYADGTFTPTTDGLSLTGTTGEDGTLTFGKTSEQTMSYNTVYCLTETVAPEGYVLDAVPHYFAVAKQQEDGKCPTFPNGVTVWYQSADYTYQTYNHKGEATVAKAFLDVGGNHLAKIDGAYRFGIYAEANPTGNPLQTVTITYANSTVTPESGTAKFTNLTLGGTYYIYELDDSGQPISGNVPATVNSSSFFVTYTNGPAVTVPADGSAAATVTVTNQVCYPELPNTGGAGTIPYTIGGFLLLTGAAFLLLYHHTKRRKEDSVSS
jgi:site-specific DNA recombinase